MMKTSLSVLILMFAFCSNAVFAQSDEADYFSIVNETGGYLTPSLYREFWEIMQTKYNEEQKSKIIEEFHNALHVLKEFQAQTWHCAKESYFTKKEARTNDYEALKTRLEKQNTQYFSPRVLIDNAEKIIQAAAARSPLDLGAGKFYITPELIEENFVGIKGSYERLKILFTPDWKEDYKEYVLPNVDVSLLSFYAPDEYHEEITNLDEKIDMHIAQLCVDKKSIYEIGSVDYQKGNKKFIDFSQPEKEIYIQEFVKEKLSSYKASPLLSKGQWRGYEYSKGIASVGEYNIVMMSLFVNNRALYIKYITNSNLSSALADFNDFTKRLQVLERKL